MLGRLKSGAINSNDKFHTAFSEKFRIFLAKSNQIIFAKEEIFRLCLISFLSKGHVLLEDQPGTGKTTLAKTFSKLCDIQMKRLQYTNDLLPSDVIGNVVYNQNQNRFEFQEGPIFTNIFLGDELNRASPRTQSASLQAMEESTVSIEGKDIRLPEPFMFFATQNPFENSGVYPLPESQLDRFTMKLSLGRLDTHQEKLLMLGEDRGKLLDHLQPMFTKEDLLKAREFVENHVTISEKVADYVGSLVESLRAQQWSVSTRAVLSVMRCAKAAAFIDARDFVSPDDVKLVLLACLIHRIRSNQDVSKRSSEEAIKLLLSQTKVPL